GRLEKSVAVSGTGDTMDTNSGRAVADCQTGKGAPKDPANEYFGHGVSGAHHPFYWQLFLYLPGNVATFLWLGGSGTGDLRAGNSGYLDAHPAPIHGTGAGPADLCAPANHAHSPQQTIHRILSFVWN